MRRCLKCMQETMSGVCPYCGYNRSAYEPQPGALKPQTRLKNRYYIGRVLGRGGFGITYNGWDTQTGRRVALKEYFPSGLAIRTEGRNTISAVSSVNTHTYKSGVVKFYDEAQILSEFRNVKEIVEIYDFFYENETSYIVMEYVEGENICQIMARQEFMDIGVAADIILKLTCAMIKVHAQDVLHRDISPSNIIVTEYGGVKLIDFGSARQYALDQSNSMSIILKNGFAPIEQYSRKGNHGPWTDIYSICATFYYMISGKPPEQATDRVIEDKLILPSKLDVDITPKQEAMLLKGLAVKASDRYQSASELKDAIEKAYVKRLVVAPHAFKEVQKTVAIAEESEPVPVQKEKKVRFVPVIATAICAGIIILTMLSLTIWRKPAVDIQKDANTTVKVDPETETVKIESSLKNSEAEKAVIRETESSVNTEAEPAVVLVTDIILNKASLTLEKGVTGSLNVTIYPTNASEDTVIWSTSNTNVAAVSDGKVKAMSAGTAVITAKTSNGKTSTCTVTVKSGIVHAESVSLNAKTYELKKGYTLTLTATIYPSDTTDNTVTWTSGNANVATVAGGKIKALSAGTAVIIAKTTNGKTATCTVTVPLVAVEKVTIEQTSVTLNSGEKVTLAATVSPGNAEDKKAMLTSSDTNVAAVNGFTVTAKNAGTATITVKTSNGKTDTCIITVKAIQATAVTLNKTSLTLKQGETTTLTATIAPSNTTDKTVTWTSNNTNVATIAGGKITAVSSGKTGITAVTSNGKTATCSVIVTVPEKAIEVSTLNISQSTMTLNSGETATLIATVSPVNATNKTLTWTSDNKGVAIVTGGKVTAISEGTAVITVKTSNEKTAICTVTVKTNIVYAESVSLNTTTYELLEGDVFNLTAIIYPLNTADKTVTWISSNTRIATVAGGKVTAISVGTVVITAKTSNDKVATCTVTVKSNIIYAEWISLDTTMKLDLQAGTFFFLSVIFYPEETTDKTITWTTSSIVARVDDGKVTLISPGVAIITAKTSNGKVATCTVGVVS